MCVCVCVGAIGVALGSGAAGAYTNSNYYWSLLEKVNYDEESCLTIDTLSLR